MAWDLARTGVTALAITPGFLRSEAMLGLFGVTEANWRDAAARDPDFANSESPHYVGRAIAALAADPNVRARAGAAYAAADLADEYDFTDIDGSRPNFWRAIVAKLQPELDAPADLSPWAMQHAAGRYQRRHLASEHADETRALAARLGWKRLGAGLQPIGGL
jgi:hypothetical protein